MGFGKYKNKTYAQVFKDYREYSIWCIETAAAARAKNNNVNNHMAAFVSYVKQKLMSL
jgi:hypothetical protein